MIEKIRRFLLGYTRREIEFLKYIEKIEKETPNNYQFGSLMRDKIRELRKGNFDSKNKKKYYSH